MAKLGNKHRLVIIKRILEEYSDAEHPLSTSEMNEKLSHYGISVDRKTLYDDMLSLNECKVVKINFTKKSRENAYNIANRVFDNQELLILIDAIASSKFLSEKISRDLISRLKSLTSKHSESLFRRTIYISNRPKTFNEDIFLNINSIQEAINSKNQITFKYSKYDENKRLKYRNNGFTYTVSPYNLVWESDNYYLLCYCHKHNNISYYRVDRMKYVANIAAVTKELSFDEDSRLKQMRETFGMYSGEPTRLEIKFKNDLMDSVIDRFGKDMRSTNNGDGTFTIYTTVQLSPPFWGWLFQFGTDAQITKPESAIAEYKNKLSTTLKMLS